MYHQVVDFPNGYSASIISHRGSYGGDKGLFEIAIMYGREIVYDTPLTHDVLGNLDFQDVVDTLKKIQNLPNRRWDFNTPSPHPTSNSQE